MWQLVIPAITQVLDKIIPRSPGSSRRQAQSADIACDNGADRFRLVQLALKHGITRIGVAKNFLHLGIGGPGLPNNVIWDYQ